MKILGLFFIFLCSLLVGALSSHKTKFALIQLRSVIEFMSYIKSQIEYFNTPVNDIYSQYDNEILKEFVSNISAHGWEEAFVKTQKIYLSSETVERLIKFGSYLGKSNKEEQIAHCTYYIEMMEDEYKKLEAEAPQKTKVSLALGLGGGLMLVILLI